MKVSRPFIYGCFVLLFCVSAEAGTVSGRIMVATSGGIANGTLSFTLSQPAMIAGTATLATSAVNCWTDSTGNVVGLPGNSAVAAPTLSIGAGALASGTYFVRYTWANATGESEPSAERSIVLGAAGGVVVLAPLNVPTAATLMKVYMSTSSGAETLQGSVAVTGGALAGNYTQASALLAGAAVPSSNTSVCSLRFNDELIPSFTNYLVGLSTLTGASVAGFPQKWYLSSGVANVSNGAPLSNGVVQYPQGIVATPAAGGTQSIAGNLTVTGVLSGGQVQATAGPGASPSITSNGDYVSAALGTLKWGSSGTAVPDTGLSRCGSGVVCAGNGSQADTTGTVYAANINGVCRVNPNTAGADLEAKIATIMANASCLVIDARGFAGTQSWGAPLAVTRSGLQILLPPVTINVTSSQFATVVQGANAVTFAGTTPIPIPGSGTNIVASAATTGAFIGVGSLAGQTIGFGWSNIRTDIGAAGAAAIGLQLNRVTDYVLNNNTFGGANGGTQKLVDLEGGVNFTGGNMGMLSCNLGQSCVFFGQNANANKIEYLQGTPQAGGFCLNLDGGGAGADGNLVAGGDCESTGAAARLDFASNNRIMIRSEANTNDILATANSINNSGEVQTGVGTLNISDSGLANFFRHASVATRILCSVLTPVTVNAATTADQNLMSCAIPGLLLTQVGKTQEVWGSIVFSTAVSTAVNLKIKQCAQAGCAAGPSQTIFNVTSAAAPAGVVNNPINFRITLQSAQNASANSIEAHGNLNIGLNGSASGPVTAYADTNTSLLGTFVLLNTTTFLQITGAFSSASAGNSFTQRQLTVNQMN
jgi:hypothetical protein